MRSFTSFILSTFASPIGVLVLAALDSSVFFSLPFGIDAAVIIYSARGSEFRWIVPLLAIVGGTVGAALTYWMGAKIGEHGLERYMSARKLERVRRRVETSGAVMLAALDLIPPPFPFTPFVLAAGALEVRPVTFFTTLAGVRLIRFGGEALLAAHYGKHIVRWLDSDLFHDLAFGFVVLAALLSAFTLFGVIRSSHRSSGRAVA